MSLSQVTEPIITGKIELDSEVIDVYTLYRVLKCIYEKKETYVSEITTCGIAKGTAVQYVKIAELLGLIVSSEKGKRKMLKLTDKGLDYLIVFERLLSLIRK
jgi:predicted transcriptional regulator